MSTPALDRAKDAFVVTHDARADDPSLTYSEFLDLLLHDAVSAALEVDVIARALAKRWWDRNAGDTDLWDDLTEAEQANVITNTDAADLANAVRDAILGETKNNEREIGHD